MTIRQMVKPVIIGISGPELTDAERELFKEHNPLGIILFRRNLRKNNNCAQYKQAIIKLIADIKEVVGENNIISIDQEGGRVKRLKSICMTLRLLKLLLIPKHINKIIVILRKS